MIKISWKDRKREQKIKQKRVERQFQQDNLLPLREYITTNIEGMGTYIVEITKEGSTPPSPKRRRSPSAQSQNP